MDLPDALPYREERISWLESRERSEINSRQAAGRGHHANLHQRCERQRAAIRAYE